MVQKLQLYSASNNADIMARYSGNLIKREWATQTAPEKVKNNKYAFNTKGSYSFVTSLSFNFARERQALTYIAELSQIKENVL